MSMDYIKLLDDFYQQRCDDEWEHDYGFMIETCDNPGWLLVLTDPGMRRIFVSGACDSMIKSVSDRYHVDVTYKREESTDEAMKIFSSSLKSLLGAGAELIAYANKLEA